MSQETHYRLIELLSSSLVKTTDNVINEGYDPKYVMGLVMVIVARQFERFNYSPEDYIDFLEHTKTLAWYPEPPKKPHLTLIKNENLTSNTIIDS